MTRRDFISTTTRTAAVLAAPSILTRAYGRGVGKSFVSERREFADRVTKRRIIQLTSGDCFDMPMYYFISSYGRGNRSIVFYRYWPSTGEIQLYKIDIDTGRTVRLTNANTQNSLWRPYLQPSGFGVRDLLSAVNAVTNEAIYFDTNDIRAVNLDTLADRSIGRVPEGRVPSGLTGVSPDGKKFCYPHFDRHWWELQLPPHTEPPERWEPRNSKLVVIDLTSGVPKDLMEVNFWITHSNFYDNNRILFCHNATDFAILMTDLRVPLKYDILRTHLDGWQPNHYHATARGVSYELFPETAKVRVGCGLYNPDTMSRQEYATDIVYNRLHIGRDSEARLWFLEGGCPGGHTISYLPALRPGQVNHAIPLMGPDQDTYSNNQRSHHHPSVTPDRKHILFTGGDGRNKTNHLFLIDIADLPDTEVQSSG